MPNSGVLPSHTYALYCILLAIVMISNSLQITLSEARRTRNLHRRAPHLAVRRPRTERPVRYLRQASRGGVCLLNEPSGRA